MLVACGHSVADAKKIPLDIVREIFLAKQQSQTENWRLARWMTTNIARSNGADIKEKDLFILPGESRTNIDKETLKKLSRERST
jgi:acetolactate synthase small subunit